MISAYVGVVDGLFAEYASHGSKHITLVTTEKNAAINNVAEALIKQYSDTEQGRAMLECTLSFGSTTMGPYTEKLSLESKVEEHPDVRAWAHRVAELEKALANCTQGSFQTEFVKLRKDQVAMFRRFVDNKSIQTEVQVAIEATEMRKYNPETFSGRV